ncbi:MAG TPA: NAD(+)/NADH kinase [Candidatus Alistipes merdigallinarum]|nr:NAD(+)/NADH kinase [Candidatus Alistipes merdigallinarum]
MNIVLYGRPQASFVGEDLNALFEALDSNGLSYRINRDFARLVADKTGRNFEEDQLYDDCPTVDPLQDVMVSYGGDGTFLDCVRLLNHRPIPVVGINSGRLGFLANVTKQGMSRAFADLKTGNYETTARTMIHIEGEFSQNPEFPYAFNEITVQRNGPNMISTEVYVNDEMIATYWGDGILVSTPSGSTAYSLSVGGPVVSPDCRCFLISPIAPHNLTMRPVVVPDDSIIRLKVSSREREFSISVDNQYYKACNGASFLVSKAEKSIFLVRFQNISFYDTLRNKMMWGIDSRDLVK